MEELSLFFGLKVSKVLVKKAEILLLLVGY